METRGDACFGSGTGGAQEGGHSDQKGEEGEGAHGHVRWQEKNILSSSGRFGGLEPCVFAPLVLVAPRGESARLKIGYVYKRLALSGHACETVGLLLVDIKKNI